MAKRIRGSSRPGHRRPVARVAAPPGPIRPTTQLTPEEEARAAELEAQIVAEERAAEQQIRRNRERGRERSREDVVAAGRPRELPPLAVRASEEYAYVRRDVLRIVRVGGSLLLVLALLYVLIDVTHVIRI